MSVACSQVKYPKKGHQQINTFGYEVQNFW